MLYSYTVLVSVRLLYLEGHRLSAYAIKTQLPAVGCLVVEPRDGAAPLARVLDDAGADLLPWLEGAHLVASGRRGMLLRGVQYRKRGHKHSYADQQAWWCQAPPAAGPMIDHAARVRAVDEWLQRETWARE